MDDSPVVPLSQEIEEMVRDQYAPKTQATISAALLEYGVRRWEGEVDRVRFDVLYLARGDSERVRKLIDLAKSDPRDVMSQEYFWRAGHRYPHAWARRYEVNRDHAEAPELDPAVIALASIARPMQKRRGVPGLVGKALYNIGGRRRWQSCYLKPHLRALFLAFANRENLEEFAKRIQTLAESKRVLDLSPALEYRWDPKPPRTILRRLHGLKEESLSYALGAVSWSGNADYWRTCSRKLMDLAKSDVPTHLSMLRDTASVQLVIGYRRPEWWPRTASMVVVTGISCPGMWPLK